MDIEHSSLAGISTQLPASAYALQLLQRGAQAGFKYKKGEHALAKVNEEYGEVLEAVAQGDRTHLAVEIGDLLHAIHALAVWYNVQPVPSGDLVTMEQSLAHTHETMAHARDLPGAIGQLLGAAEQLAKQHGFAAPELLTQANTKWARRFVGMEHDACSQGKLLSEMPLAEQVVLWNAQKDSDSPAAAR